MRKMLRTTSGIAVLFLSVAAISLAAIAPASAQQASVTTVAQQPGQTNCTDRSSALSHLSKAYKEQPVAMGLASSGGVVEVLTDDQGSSWSIIVTLPTGVTCLVAAGEDWESLQPVAEGKIL